VAINEASTRYGRTGYRAGVPPSWEGDPGRRMMTRRGLPPVGRAQWLSGSAKASAASTSWSSCCATAIRWPWSRSWSRSRLPGGLVLW